MCLRYAACARVRASAHSAARYRYYHARARYFTSRAFASLFAAAPSKRARFHRRVTAAASPPERYHGSSPRAFGVTCFQPLPLRVALRAALSAASGAMRSMRNIGDHHTSSIHRIGLFIFLTSLPFAEECSFLFSLPSHVTCATIRQPLSAAFLFTHFHNSLIVIFIILPNTSPYSSSTSPHSTGYTLPDNNNTPEEEPPIRTNSFTTAINE
jgi:hypothetical protein